MATPIQIVENDPFIMLLQSTGTIWYCPNSLPLVWTQIPFGGTGIPQNLFLAAVKFKDPPLATLLIIPHLCVISNDGTLWVFNTEAKTWTKLTNLPAT